MALFSNSLVPGSRRAITYDRLVLRIGPDPRGGGGLAVSVVQSPLGETGSGPFESPFDDEELVDMVRSLAAPGVRHLRPEPGRLPTDHLSVGQRLGEALFVGPVERALGGGLGRVGSRPGLGLRIELRIDRDLPQAASLHALPWEFLTVPGEVRPLCLDHRTPVARYLELSRPYPRTSRPRVFRILVVAPRPEDLPPLDLDSELSDLRSPWSGGVEVEVLDPPTLTALQGALRASPFHGLHFMGHGRFDGERGVGELVFEDEDGRADEVPAEILAEQVEDSATVPRIVVVNACQSARAGARHPTLGVAPAMVSIGVSAVVAMQFPVSDRAAISFSRSLYRSLAAGQPVDAAVAEGRRAIRRDLRDRPEEAMTPVLFLATEDGFLFETDRGRRAVLWGAAAVLGLLLLLLATLSGLENGPTGGAEPDRPVEALDSGSRAEGEEDPAEDGSAFLRSAMLPQPLFGEADGGGADRAGARVTDQGGERLEDGEDRVPAVYTVSGGESVRVPEVASFVRADFLTLYGEGFVRLSVSADDGAVGTKAAMGPEPVEVDVGGRSILLQVLGIDWERKRVELRAAPSP